MAEAIIGAVIGAVIGGVISAYVATRIARKQIESSQREGKTARTWDIAFAASQVQSEILSAYTPDRVKTVDDVFKLQEEWGIQGRRLHILGAPQIAKELSDTINDYLRALRELVQGDMQRGELEHRRAGAKDKVAAIMSQFR